MSGQGVCVGQPPVLLLAALNDRAATANPWISRTSASPQTSVRQEPFQQVVMEQDERSDQ
jgi:hypothetical protein